MQQMQMPDASTLERPNANLMNDFGEHRQSILNHRQLSEPTLVSLHFNHAGNSINDIILVPLEIIRSNRDPVRKPREDHHLIHKGNTLSPLGISRRNKAR